MTAPDGTTSLLRDYSTDPSFTWDTSGLDGTYTVLVDVRAEQSPTQPPSRKSLRVAVGDACTQVTLADTWGSHQRTEPLSLVATIGCGSGEVAFQMRTAAESAWTTVCPYSPQTSCALDVSTRWAGDYAVRALVRKVGAIAASDAASAVRDFVLLDGPALIRRLPEGINPSVMSRDGRWFAGGGRSPSGFVRWSRANGTTALAGETNWSGSDLFGISNNGVVVGAFNGGGATTINRATVWSGSTITSLLPPSGFYTHGWGVSANGQVVVGDGARNGLAAFRWTAKGGLVDIGGSGFRYTTAYSVSADGNVIVGSAQLTTPGPSMPALWTAKTGMVSLGLLPGCTGGGASLVSDDGKTVIGSCSGPGVNYRFRWTAATGLQPIVLPTGIDFMSTFDTNGDGSVIVGNTLANGEPVPTIWSVGAGFQYLTDVLAATGTDLGGWDLSGLHDISTDGKTLLGIDSSYQSFVVTLP